MTPLGTRCPRPLGYIRAVTSGDFSVAEVARAMGRPVTTVEVMTTFISATATVARLRVRFADGSNLIAIGKRATGDGAAAARRERRFFERLAPCWDPPAPRLLGASDDAVSVLLVTEDLEAKVIARSERRCPSLNSMARSTRWWACTRGSGTRCRSR
ncbi:hypothetical protein [Corallococcus sp. 4LFB]|uniref:hypothetical protein n=1 Tax=Corallococcus sp. 4LFB TaxID=3383249 RepID=UPI0039769D9B